MKFDPLSPSAPHITYALLGGFVCVFGMFSLWLKARLYISEAVWATLFGIIVGPYGAGIFNPREWGGEEDTLEGTVTVNTITLEVMRVVLAIGVFAIGVELPKAYLWHHVRSVLLILFPVMAYGWVVCAALIYGLVPGLSFLSSLIVAACLTPTDPILASAVVGGKWADKHVPAHLRHLLAAESAVNDGLAFPFLYLGLYLFLENGDTKEAIGEWFYWTWLYEIALGCTLGAVLGVAFRHLMQFCERKDLIDRTSYLAQYLSLALLAIGITTILGSDDLLCAFFAGTGFGWNGFFQKQTEDSMFSNAMDLLFNVAAFIYIGAWLPFASYADIRLTLSVWRLIVLGILIILVRRLPICVAIYYWIPDIKTFREALFTGHFGPMGVGAVFISTLAAMALPSKGSLGDAPYGQEQLLSGSIQPIVSFIVLCSILSHGLSVPAFSLTKRVHSLSLSVHTRSWSRHASMDIGREPEWATHAKRVVRPEDVVINRDRDRDRERERERDLEKAEQVDEKGVTTVRGVESREKEEGEHRRRGAHIEGGTGEVAGVGESPGASGSGSAGGEGEGEGFAGGEELGPKESNASTIRSWKEGNYLVVEKELLPGGDVEVEVHRQSTHPQLQNSQTFRGSVDEARAAGKAYVERIEDRARQVREKLRSEGRLVGLAIEEARTESARRAGERLMGAFEGNEGALGETLEGHEVRGVEVQDAEPGVDEAEVDDAWRDEDAETDHPPFHPPPVSRSPSPPPMSPSSPTSTHSHKSRRHRLFGPSSGSRRRDTLRRTVLGTRPAPAPPAGRKQTVPPPSQPDPSAGPSQTQSYFTPTPEYPMRPILTSPGVGDSTPASRKGSRPGSPVPGGTGGGGGGEAEEGDSAGGVSGHGSMRVRFV